MLLEQAAVACCSLPSTPQKKAAFGDLKQLLETALSYLEP